MTTILRLLVLAGVTGLGVVALATAAICERLRGRRAVHPPAASVRRQRCAA